MRESVINQAILEKGLAEARAAGYGEGWAIAWAEGYLEGRILEAKRILLRQGRQRFGPAPRALQRKVNAIEDLKKLRKIVTRPLVATRWAELIGD